MKNVPLRKLAAAPPVPAVLAVLGLLAALILSGCAAKVPQAVPGKADAQAVWNAFKKDGAGQPDWTSFSLNASLSFAAQSASGRLNAKFWGNMDGPLRLDFTTPMGGPYALWREDASGWLAYYPGEGAYSHSDTRKGMAKLGMPLPFDLRELAAAATGRLSEYIPAEYERAKIAPDGYEYLFAAGAPLKSMTLDFDGNPIHLAGRGVDPWQVDFEDYAIPEGLARPMAQKITLITPGGTQARLRVKKLEVSAEPWPESALELTPPTGVTIVPLDLLEDVAAPTP